DGIEPILDLQEPEILRSSGVPGFMLGGQRRSMSLNQSDSTSSMLMFGRRLEQGVLDFNEVMTEALVPIRVFLGIDEECGFEAQYDDTEIQKIRAEIASVKIEVFDKAIKAGLISQEQGVRMLTTDTFDFTELHGEEIPDMPQPQAPPQPQPTDEGGEEDA
ncbi:MAG: hypothetical protein OXE50_15585, partial [Chloroflexi bacterium]|nr:hypothetical protein [Chloroflexota bacterium]